MCVSWDNSFPNVRQEPHSGPGKGWLTFLQQNHGRFQKQDILIKLVPWMKFFSQIPLSTKLLFTFCIFSHSETVTCKPSLHLLCLPSPIFCFFVFCSKSKARRAVYFKDMIRVNLKGFFCILCVCLFLFLGKFLTSYLVLLAYAKISDFVISKEILS